MDRIICIRGQLVHVCRNYSVSRVQASTKGRYFVVPEFLNGCWDSSITNYHTNYWFCLSGNLVGSRGYWKLNAYNYHHFKPWHLFSWNNWSLPFRYYYKLNKLTDNTFQIYHDFSSHRDILRDYNMVNALKNCKKVAFTNRMYLLFGAKTLTNQNNLPEGEIVHFWLYRSYMRVVRAYWLRIIQGILETWYCKAAYCVAKFGLSTAKVSTWESFRDFASRNSWYCHCCSIATATFTANVSVISHQSAKKQHHVANQRRKRLICLLSIFSETLMRFFYFMCGDGYIIQKVIPYVKLHILICPDNWSIERPLEVRAATKMHI